METWKDIPNYEGKYMVSSIGNVKSLNFKNTKKEKILKTTIAKCGYYYITLCKDGVRKKKYNHQLVAITFLNHKPNKFEKVVNHKNFDKLDNRVENLEIVSNRENTSKKHMKSSSIYTGVAWEKNINKWKSKINIKTHHIHLGYYKDEKQASEIYELAVKLVDKHNGVAKDFRELVKKEYEQNINRSNKLYK